MCHPRRAGARVNYASALYSYGARRSIIARRIGRARRVAETRSFPRDTSVDIKVGARAAPRDFGSTDNINPGDRRALLRDVVGVDSLRATQRGEFSVSPRSRARASPLRLSRSPFLAVRRLGVHTARAKVGVAFQCSRCRAKGPTALLRANRIHPRAFGCQEAEEPARRPSRGARACRRAKNLVCFREREHVG